MNIFKHQLRPLASTVRAARIGIGACSGFMPKYERSRSPNFNLWVPGLGVRITNGRRALSPGHVVESNLLEVGFCEFPTSVVHIRFVMWYFGLFAQVRLAKPLTTLPGGRGAFRALYHDDVSTMAFWPSQSHWSSPSKSDVVSRILGWIEWRVSLLVGDYCCRSCAKRDAQRPAR